MQSNAPGPSARSKAREAFFLSFAKAIRSHFPSVPLIVTGGFRSRQGMATAVGDGDCDLVGLARPAVLEPALPQTKIFNDTFNDSEKLYTRRLDKPVLERIIGSGVVGAGAESVSLYPCQKGSGFRTDMAQAWYSKQIQKNGDA